MTEKERSPFSVFDSKKGRFRIPYPEASLLFIYCVFVLRPSVPALTIGVDVLRDQLPTLFGVVIASLYGLANH